jgi:hypothetical protein
LDLVDVDLLVSCGVFGVAFIQVACKFLESAIYGAERQEVVQLLRKAKRRGFGSPTYHPRQGKALPYR